MPISSDFEAILPEILLLFGACLLLVVDLFTDEAKRDRGYVLALCLLALVAWFDLGPIRDSRVLFPFEGMLVVDPMAAVLKVFATLATALALVYSRKHATDRGMWRGELFALALLTLLGVQTMISANNLLVVYLGLELQALSLYGLVALRRDNAAASEAAMKYFVLGALASGFLLYGMSMLYGATGSLDINAIAHRIGSGQVASHSVLALAAIFLVAGIGFKLGAVPFHMWVPDVYEGAPTPVALLIGSAPKLAAFAIAFRLLVEGMPQMAIDWQHLLAFLAVASIVVGNVTAVAQTNLKRMLGFSTIAQMGFLLLAMLSGVAGNVLEVTAQAYGAGMFYVITYALATAGAFGTILLLSRAGFEASEIRDLRGLAKRSPWYAFVMSLIMFSLAGVPPTVGFYAKLVVLQALLGDGATAGAIWLAVIAVVFSLVGAFYYIRVIRTMWFDEPEDASAIESTGDMRAALSVNGAAMLVLGVLPQGLLALCNVAVTRSLGG
jgi:NADH-quinone oxidoreductase subunit N